MKKSVQKLEAHRGLKKAPTHRRGVTQSRGFPRMCEPGAQYRGLRVGTRTPVASSLLLCPPEAIKAVIWEIIQAVFITQKA